MTGLLTALFITALAIGCFTLIFFICKTVDDIGIDRAEKKKIKEQRIKNVLMAFGDLDVTFEQFIAMYNIRPEQFLILDYKVERTTDLGERSFTFIASLIEYTSFQANSPVFLISSKSAV